jgi:hypothetical protein
MLTAATASCRCGTGAQRRIAEAVPYISLWYKTNVAIFQPDITDVSLSPNADFAFLRNVALASAFVRASR